MTIFYLIVGFILSFSIWAAPVNNECTEDNVVLFREFLAGNFDEARSTVGQDQVEPVKAKILDFLNSNSDVVVSSVQVTSVSSKIPFYIILDGKKNIDPKSNQRNFSLAQDRAFFLEKVINKTKESNSSIGKIKFYISAELGGPDFNTLDLNDRFITKMSPHYLQKVEAIYKKFEIEFKEQALTFSVTDLLDEKKFGNLFQVKYKPFQGFRISYSGFKKTESKCSHYSKQDLDLKNKTSKQ